ncbi:MULTISPECIES: peptidylprolyl isomerase [unclassified Polaribacter]|uniref:peptidylprolyl isomerase n=1 Tax=unclassified Polaribacter TaxID=196858 RepID=UPI0011BF37A0|nr:MULTISPECIES: peptidylprolyl isomerase [unclassified Polaribacter]TXD52582.1 peptidylprolyl isomerase [Polaribacter sp. IC063]TXD61857.1 peptidylprolyl isomerase [Polaribacter sp. IC066]
MKSLLNFFLLALLIGSIFGCKKQSELLNDSQENRTKIAITTNYGSMIVELYNETPLHRDNMINLVNNNAYDSLLFHRIIHEFMIQGGDPDSRNAQPKVSLGDGDAPYLIDAEFNAKLFHKKGALAAARGDNPERASSGMQFYIVQGEKLNDSLLKLSEVNINRNVAREFFRNHNRKKSLRDSIDKASKQDKMNRYNKLMDSILYLANTEEKFKLYKIPKEQREIYKSIGGAPYLDQNYTVFGEVVKGIEVLDTIASVKTNAEDRPISDVIILKIKLLN